MKMKNLYLAIAVIITLASCSGGGSHSDLSGEEAGTENTTSRTPYDFANGCYALKSVANDSFIMSAGPVYDATAQDLSKASAFFMKPSGLGTYLLYDRLARYLSVDANQSVIRTSTLDDNTMWELTSVGEDLFALKSAAGGLSKGKWLAVSADDGQLSLSSSLSESCQFRLEETSNC